MISRTFPGRPEQVRVARRWLNEWLGADHPGADSAMLLLSETFSNGLLYGEAGAPLEVVVELNEHHVRVEVVNAGGDDEPTLIDPAGTAENGRGLALVDLLAKEWGFSRLADGRTQVWFSVQY